MFTLKLFKNTFAKKDEITGFTKEGILDAKKSIESAQKAEDERSAVDEFLEELFPENFLTETSEYLSQLQRFINGYIQMDQEGEQDKNFYISLKKALIEELSNLSANLLNFKLNSQNIKRFLKQKDQIKQKTKASKKLHKKTEDIKKRVESLIPGGKARPYNNRSAIWKHINEIKHTFYVIKRKPQDGLEWAELTNLITLIEEIEIQRKESEDEESKKRFKLFGKKEKEKKEEKGIFFRLADLLEKIKESLENEKEKEVYEDLIYLYYTNNIIQESEIRQTAQSEQKKIKSKLKDYVEDLIKEAIRDYLSDEISKIQKWDKKFDILSDQKNFDNLESDKMEINDFLPALFKLYFEGIEQEFQEEINNLKEKEFSGIINAYQSDIEQLTGSYQQLNEKIEELALFTYPYQEIITPIRKILENIEDLIERRQESFIEYLKTLKTEKIRDSARNYVEQKKERLNTFMNEVKEEMATILHDEFPQLKKMKKVLKDYAQKVEGIKSDVYAKLDTFKEDNVDMYQQIKSWEENLAVKQQQLNFTISMILKRLYKDFNKLIDTEEMLFSSISDGVDSENEAIPLNFALSNFLIDKLTEQELKERITEVKIQINQSEKALKLYRSELQKLEGRMTEKVKTREGIDKDVMKCTVCRQDIKIGKDKVIVCPFCKNAYHYLCVADWITKYNSCPTCQNQFLDPNGGLYHIEEENYD